MSTTPTELLETTAAALETTIAATESAIAETAAATEGALDIESIKALMDGFEPASLLPNLSGVFESLAPICRFAVMAGPIVLLVLGLAYLFLSPKEANYYFGYRCYYGMGSVHAWRFTQRLAGLLFSAAGILMSIVMFTLSAGFDGMEVTDMVWKAADCLVWEAGIVIGLTLFVNLMAMFRFDRRGELRKKKKAK